MNDSNQVINIIKQTQRKLREEMRDIVKQKATQSRYSAMSRSERRTTEFHHDRLTQEQSLQKDCKKAERLARRIGLILERLRKDFNKIKNHLGNYNFTSTVGVDSNCGGACDSDLSTDIGTRQAWKRELVNLLTMVWHYVDAQYLGDYALLHTPNPPASDTTCHSNVSAYNCCPKVYRPYFHYFTPDGDCLTIPSEVGQHSGDSTTMTPTGSYNNKETTGSILQYRGLADTVSAGEDKATPASHKHFQVCNKDVEIRQLWKLLVGTTGGNTVDRVAWWSFLIANAEVAYDSGAATNAGELKTYYENTVCLPAAMIESLELADGSQDSATHEKIHETIYLIVSGGTSATDATAGVSSSLISRTNPPVASASYLPGNVDVVGGSGAFDLSLTHAPTICHIEDEADIPFVVKLIVSVMNNIRSCQINNDREQQVIEYVNEVAECNEAFHQDVFSDLTSIDESELEQRYAVGKEMAADLNALNKESCCNKQNFFRDLC